MANSKVSDVAAKFGSSAVQRIFTPRTFERKNGDVGGVLVTGNSRNGLNAKDALLVLQHQDECIASLEELADAIAAGNGNGAQPSGNQRMSELAERMAKGKAA